MALAAQVTSTQYVFHALGAEDMAAFPDRFRSVLGKYGYTPCSLAKRSGISVHVIYKWIGYKTLPNLSSLYVIRHALGCTWDELLGGLDDERN